MHMNYSQIMTPAPLCLEKWGVMTPQLLWERRPWTATVCFKQKTNFVMQNLGDLGTNGGRGLTFLVENVMFGIADPDLSSLCNFYGATMMIKGSLLLSTASLSTFVRKKLFLKSPVLGQNLTVFGDK